MPVIGLYSFLYAALDSLQSIRCNTVGTCVFRCFVYIDVSFPLIEDTFSVIWTQSSASLRIKEPCFLLIPVCAETTFALQKVNDGDICTCTKIL